MVAAGTQLGEYRLLRRIGSGGMAEVFLGTKTGAEGFARTVAIKTILAHGTEEEAVNLFLDEARVAGFLNHAAIVETVDLGFENETLFIVMEYVAGPPLSRVVRELRKMGRFLAPEIVAYVGARVASALDYAHRRATAPDGRPLALVHRDISPQNIMLARSGLVKLTDFGVARASTQTHRTKTGQVRGKAAYMAPEQVRAKQLDGRTDVFALGLVLYEALTSTRAYHRQSDIIAMRAILTDPVRPIRELNPDAPADLIAVITKAIEKRPEDRWQHAGELEAALLACCGRKSPTRIEADIEQLIERLFGSAESPEAEGMVEAWQPTIAVAAEDAAPELAPNAERSARLREILGTPPSSASAPEVVTPQVVRTPLAQTAQVAHVAPRQSRALRVLGLGTLAVLLVTVGALASIALRFTSAPIADPPPALEPPARPAPLTPPRARELPAPPPAEAPPPTRPAPAPPPQKRIRTEAPKRAPEVPPVPPQKIDPQVFKARAMKAWRAHQQRTNLAWAEKLQSVVINLEMRSPTAADEELVRQAEAALRSAD